MLFPTVGRTVGADRRRAGGEGRLVNMLVNMMGIEPNDEIVEMSDRRVEATIDPKARVTLASLFGEVLASFLNISAAPPAPPVSAPVVRHGFAAKPKIASQTSQQDAA